jgi:hypothetical protein
MFDFEGHEYTGINDHKSPVREEQKKENVVLMDIGCSIVSFCFQIITNVVSGIQHILFNTFLLVENHIGPTKFLWGPISK